MFFICQNELTDHKKDDCGVSEAKIDNDITFESTSFCKLY